MSACDYDKSLQYWADIPATLDGVLGGFGFISDVDIEGSRLFLNSIFSSDHPPAAFTAIDCGAGIGRITKHLLIPHFDLVDVVESDEKFINSVKDFVGEYKNKIGTLYQVSLQDFKPEKKYDVIWIQWVLGYLTDKDLVTFLDRCSNALNDQGVIIIKENVTSSGKLEIDDIDSSVTRSLKKFISIFKQCKLKRMKHHKQTNFPNGLYPVYMFALAPKSTKDVNC